MPLALFVLWVLALLELRHQVHRGYWRDADLALAILWFVGLLILLGYLVAQFNHLPTE